MNSIQTIQRTALRYELTLAIDVETTYRRTYTDDVGHAWNYEQSHGQLYRLAELAVGETNATLDGLTVEPGVLRATVLPDSHHGTRPKDLITALTQTSTAWNEEYGTRVAGEYLDAIHFDGLRLFEVVRPEDALTPAAFIEQHCVPDADDAPDAAPDGDEGPIFEVGPGVEHSDAPASDRHIPLTAIVPIDPETYSPVESDSYDSTTWAYEWTEEIERQFRHFAHKYTRWNGDDWRIAIHPYHTRVDVISGSVSNTPAETTIAEITALISKFNSRRKPLSDVELAGAEVALRPELQLGEDVAYVGASTTEGVTEEWIQAKGLDAVDGEPFDPEPEPEPVPDGGDGDEDSDGGSLLDAIGRAVGTERKHLK